MPRDGFWLARLAIKTRYEFIDITMTATYLKVHVIPESREEAVVKREDIFYVSVREKAERGAANRRMFELLRKYLGGLPGKRLAIMSGHHAPHKIISVD